MNILELNLSPDYGGLELHMRDFSVWLSEKKDCCLFLTLQSDTRLAEALLPLKVPTLLFSAHCGKLPVFSARKLKRFIRENKIDVVHVHWKNDLPLVALAKRQSKRPFRFIHTRQMNLPARKHDPYHRFIYGSLDCFISITDYILENARKNLPIAENKLIRIYHGAHVPQNITPENSDRIKKKLGIGKTFSIGLFGRISEFKGQHLLIEAVQRLNNEGIGVQAWIVGEAFEEVYLNKLKKMTKDLDLEDQIRFPGFYENPMELMSCLDAVILTTKKESFGLVLIEAMHAGIPVIGSNAGGVPEIIDHKTTGLLFETWNSLSLASMIKELIRDDKLRKNLAINGQLKAKQQFDLDKQYQKFYNAMNKLL